MRHPLRGKRCATPGVFRFALYTLHEIKQSVGCNERSELHHQLHEANCEPATGLDTCILTDLELLRICADVQGKFGFKRKNRRKKSNGSEHSGLDSRQRSG